MQWGRGVVDNILVLGAGELSSRPPYALRLTSPSFAIGVGVG